MAQLLTHPRPSAGTAAMIVLSAVAYAEEILLLCLLPTWKSDVRGLYWGTFEQEGEGAV